MSAKVVRLLFTFLALLQLSLSELYKPTDSITCSTESHCPLEWPCCSPYGECGSGPICIGGCDPRYSYNDESCIPLPVLVYPFNVAFHHNFLSRKFQLASNERYGMENNLHDNVNIIPLNERMNEKGFIQHSNFLIAKNDQIARNMLNNFDFIYSGSTNIDSSTGDILLAMPQHTTGSLIASTREFLYGKATVTMKTARSQGVVTAIVLISQVGDEIDFEFLGSQLFDAQTNYYFQTELDYTRMQKQPISTNSFENYHTYGFDWSEERIIWLIDGKPMRTLFKKDTWDPIRQVYKYPQTPARLEIAIWPGGNENNHPGTIEWAGGRIDWQNSPDILENGQFYAKVKEMHIEPKQNKYFGEIYNCISTKIHKHHDEITDLLKVTSSYDHTISPKFTEHSLQWHCDYIPRIKSHKDSGFSTKHKLFRNFPRGNPLKFNGVTVVDKELSKVDDESNNISNTSFICQEKKRIFDATKIDMISEKNTSRTVIILEETILNDSQLVQKSVACRSRPKLSTIYISILKSIVEAWSIVHTLDTFL